MHAGTPLSNAPWIWLFSGTGEGPPLAAALRQRGWRVRVWVVAAVAARAYPRDEGLVVEVGALGGADPLRSTLQAAGRAGAAPRWVVDATHPFAQRISADLARVCPPLGVPLLRLQRPPLPPGRAVLLPTLEALGQQRLVGRALLLAIGARQLAAARAHSPAAAHHARLLPSAGALALAMAAGLAPERVACLRPTESGLLERALCRRWGIEAVLARQSGGAPEQLWHGITQELGLDLLLLRRPPEPEGVVCLEAADLLQRLGDPQWFLPPGSAP